MVESILSPEQIARFDADGFLVVEDLFTVEEVARVLEIARIDPQLKGDTKSNQNYDDEAEGVGTVLAYRPTLSQDAYSYMAGSRRVIEPLEQLLRDQAVHFYHLIMQKDPGTGGWQYHQDYGYHYKEFLFPDYISFMIALEPAVAANGCIRVYRGSNRLGRLEHQPSGSQLITDPKRLARAAEHLEEVHCELAPGSVLFFHGNTLHASSPNNSDQGRWSLVSSYTAAGNPWVGPVDARERGGVVDKLDDAELAAKVQKYWQRVQA